MSKQCVACDELFELGETDRKFLAKMEVPEPTHCYFCRMLRRLSQRNERFLYHRKCDLSGKQIISSFSVDKPFPVYDIDVWWSDRWNALDYGRDFDFSRPFFEQFHSLRREVPRLALQQQKPMQNSAYCNCAARNKNCYLVFSTNSCEDCYYGSWVNSSRDCLDNLNIEGCELCYECVGCRDCYNVRYSRDSSSCVDSLFLRDCTGCKNCIGCTSLINQQYCLFNETVGKERYDDFLKGLDLGSYRTIEKLRGQIEQALGVIKVKELHGLSLEQSTGDYLRHCKRVHSSFECDECEDVRYSMCIQKSKSCMDYSYWGSGAELIYECQACGFDLFNLRFCNICWSGCRDLSYCDHCFSTKKSFGCIGLRQNEHCILNKQYSAHDYDKLVPKIIAHMKESGEWGEFFPTSGSTYAYNESLAQEHLPLNEAQVRERGWLWHSEYEEKKTNYLGPRVELPDCVADIDETICDKILRCELTGKPYKIVSPELKFYLKNQIPLPRISPNARHAKRLTQKNPRVLWERNCTGCRKDIVTSYAPKRPEKVYCEDCYHKEVYR